MQRPHSIDPRVFIEVILLAGCELGPSNASMQSIKNPKGPGLHAVVDLTGLLHTRAIEAHLRNLDISEVHFLKCFDRFANRNLT